MSTSRAALAALLGFAAAASACGDSAPRLSAGLAGPSAVVRFAGITARHPGELRPYLAVTSTRGNELRIVNPEDDRAVLGPTLVLPLSIPTDPRPLKLAAASLGDGGADLLVVASPGALGGPAVEVVVTWDASNRTLRDPISLGAPASAEILSLAAAPVPGAPGKARLVAGLATPTGGQLAVVEFRREGQAVVAGPPALRPLAGAAGSIDPVDLAFSPDGDRLFAATPDPVGAGPAGAIFGVAELALVGSDPAAWTLAPLDARAPTTLVAAAVVAERALLDGDGSPADDPDLFPEGSAALRVYAALDPAGCGPAKPIRCGVATLLPGVGLAPDPARVIGAALGDPARGMAYRAPIEVPGTVLDLAVGVAPGELVANAFCATGENPSPATARAHLAPSAGQRCTSAVGVALSSDGNTYVLDLGRFELPSETSVLASDATRTLVTAAASSKPLVDPADASKGVQPGATLGLVLSDGRVVTGADAAGVNELAAGITLTPGFVETDTFDVTWQGALPGLVGRRGVVVRTAPGTFVLAAQTDSGARGPAGEVLWTVGARLGDPELGVRAGDLALTETAAVGVCPGDDAAARASSEGAVLAVEAPSVAVPGGGLRLSPGCWAAALDADGEAVEVTFTLRAQALVLTSTLLGCLGWPELDGAAYALQYREADDPPVATTEAHLLSRKARRRFYPAEYPGCGTAEGAEICADYPAHGHPLLDGPLVALRVARLPGEAGLLPPRDASIRFATRGGYTPMGRRPSGASLPVAAVAVDRALFAPANEVRWYVAYADDQLFVFGPGEPTSQAFNIR